MKCYWCAKEDIQNNADAAEYLRMAEMCEEALK